VLGRQYEEGRDGRGLGVSDALMAPDCRIILDDTHRSRERDIISALDISFRFWHTPRMTSLPTIGLAGLQQA
jgi:hypothetical protein